MTQENKLQTIKRLNHWLTYNAGFDQVVLCEMQAFEADAESFEFATIAVFTDNTPVKAIKAFVKHYITYGDSNLVFLHRFEVENTFWADRQELIENELEGMFNQPISA